MPLPRVLNALEFLFVQMEGYDPDEDQVQVGGIPVQTPVPAATEEEWTPAQIQEGTASLMNLGAEVQRRK